jgi:hypothetical protein
MFGHDDHDNNDNTTTVDPAVAGTAPTPSATDDTADETSLDTAPTSPSGDSRDFADTPDDTPDDTPGDTPATTPSADTNEDTDLLELKKQALDELSPLLDHLDQDPEEKFQTTMMMIQATDSPKLVKVAHEAALKIEDEKKRAQALLDIVNEINYFTQSKSDD